MTISRRQFIATSAASLLVGTGSLRAQDTRTANMLTKQIPSSGEQLPVIGLGTLQAFDVAGTPEERAALSEVLSLLAAQGGTLVDTSPRYGRAEAVVGDLCEELNMTDELFFATKVFSEGEQAGSDEMDRAPALPGGGPYAGSQHARLGGTSTVNSQTQGRRQG
jgi:hypothetical protein